ncbi:Holliday junction branch migration protein RuvA [Candidatus Falkowbacteria bacterium]|nr:Holliday junction branch migration protein RuvA [Candidatus Falkowbacteria bacterium]
MISFLRGQVLAKHKNYFIVLVHDVGYQVFVNQTLFSEFVAGQPVELYTHQYIKEDALDLYGFKNIQEMEMFELLLSISGVGPKSALGILSVAKTDELKLAISRGDSSILTKVSGVGKKTAERIVLELREKVLAVGDGDLAGGAVSQSLAQSDEIDALLALGYSLQQAREALREVDPALKSSSERIRAALKMLAR